MLPLLPVPRGRPVGRYAPSPTGDLHLGNLRTALLAWRRIRDLGGIFMLRIEDIDIARTVAAFERRILDDLRWLGIDWDEGPDVSGPAGPYRQTERAPIYEAALARLEAAGRTYLCTCSRKDLREASAPHDPDGPEGPVYPGTCRDADPETQRAHPLGAATRLRVDARPVVFADAVAGPQIFNLESLCGDFIVRRRDGLWAYQLACAVDDALMGVTHVLRGADLLSSTPRQIAIMHALDLPVPSYAHVPLVVDERGERLSKRDGSQTLRALRESGLTPEAAREAILGAPLAAE
jgi:glutamyl-tRNA synthetase